MSSCPCSCHGMPGAFARCTGEYADGGCGHLHRSESLPDLRALAGLDPRGPSIPEPLRPRPVVEPGPELLLPVTVKRPDGACLTHRPPKPGQSWRRADSSYRTCSACYDRLHKWLSPIGVDDEGRSDNIPVLYAALDATPGGNGHGRRAPGFGSRSPGSDHVISIRDRRSKSYEVARDGVEYVWDPDVDNGIPWSPGAYVEKRDVWFGSDGKAYREETSPARSIPHVLGSWVQLVSEEREVKPGTGDVADLCVWLDRNLDWITRQDWVDEFHTDLQDLRGRLRTATGNGGQSPVGYCIELLDTGECRAPIYMPRGEKPRAPDEPITDLPELKCPACDSRYTGRRLILLRMNREKQKAVTGVGHPAP